MGIIHNNPYSIVFLLFAQHIYNVQSAFDILYYKGRQVLLLENKSYHLHFLEFQSIKNREMLYEKYRQFFNK
jgi:mRNA degradation ribonuclease J1/J2